MKKKKTKQCSRRVREGKQNSLASIDRLSDDLLVHILSLLPIEFSATTSILGRRWRFLWAHAPNLEFNSDDHRSRTRFANIINRVMVLHKGHSINTFGLYYFYDDCSDYEFETWIATLVACNVRNLTIVLDDQVMLPRCLFTCKTLVRLCLGSVGNIPMTGAIYFPALKKLELHVVTYESDESLPHLLSGCPVLEELSMMMIEDMICCCISSPTLNRLVIRSVYQGVDDEVYKVKLDTPALRYLRLDDSMFEDFSTGALTSLIEANINFNFKDRTESEVLYSRSVIEFVGKLHNVEYLQLSTRDMAVHDFAFDALTIKFHNLTKLELAANIRFIPFFLERADNLEVLSISMVDGNVNEWMESHQVPTCLLLHLKTVTMDRFKCTEDEFELIRYFLMNAEVLRLMKINSQHYKIDLKGRFDALKRISKFQRGSKACGIDFL